MKNGRETSRRYHQKERRQPVFIFIDGKTYTGTIADRSQSGLGILTKENPAVNQGDYIPLMYLGKPEMKFAVNGLRVAHVSKSHGSTFFRIGIIAPDEPTRTRLNEVIRFSIETKPDQASGNINPQKIPPFPGDKHYTNAAVNARLDWARQVSGASLQNIERSILKPEALPGNIENYIGAVQIPIGIAGPIFIKGIDTDTYVPVPIATTEGALISSITRGCRVCNRAGGVNVAVTRQFMVRAPVFFCEDMHGALNLEQWIHNNFEKLRDKAHSVSSVARLRDIETFVFGATIHAKFRYTTGDASGQNMTTACTWVACEWLIKEIKNDRSIKYISYLIEGNMSGDKKVNLQNYLSGRGIGVIANIHVPGRILSNILRVDPEKYIRHIEAASVSAIHIGMMGSNINFANVIAGVFAATGQDIACVHESSLGIFKAEKDGDGITFNVSLPSLVIGTVGGGTKLPTQRDCLELMGCYGPGKVFRFAEILAATCLALDISTSAAIIANEFVRAHERLGRNRPVKQLTKDSIDTKFLASLFQDQNTRVFSFEGLPLQQDASIITKLLQDRSKSLVGIFRYRLQVENGRGYKTIPTVLKLKSADHHLIDIGASLARLSGEDRLPGLFETQFHIFGFNNSNMREIGFYRHAKNEILRYAPKIYGAKIDDERELFATLMEDLSSMSHIDTAKDISLWDDQSIRTVLHDLACMHAVYFNDFGAIPKEVMVNTLNKETLCGAYEFLSELTDYNARQFPDLIKAECREVYLDFLNHLSERIDEMHAFPMTLTHNDFNYRNICLRDVTKQPRLVVYDWELACYQNPQHDLIEFLVYALGDKTSKHTIDRYATYYLAILQEKTGLSFPASAFHRVLYLNAVELGLVRFNVYLLTHNIVRFNFLDRVYGNLVNYILAHHQGAEMGTDHFPTLSKSKVHALSITREDRADV